MSYKIVLHIIHVRTSPSKSLMNQGNLMSVWGHMSGLRVVFTRETHLLESISPEEEGPAPGIDWVWESLTCEGVRG